jgi:prepilin-type N-terminal cleavage/methylation domain-containing protein
MNIPSITAKGFTLVELLVVFSILVIIVSLTMIGFRNYAGFQQYNQAVNDVVFVLNEARLSARSAKGDEAHGVKVTTDSLTQFVGDAFTSGDPENITSSYELVTLTHDLAGGVDEIRFEKLTGLPSATGTITIVGTAFEATTTIEVTGTGVVQ